MEQEYLLFSETQRDILEVMFEFEKPMTAFNIRMEAYKFKILSYNILPISISKKESIILLKKQPSDLEKELRVIAKRNYIRLSSNLKFNSSLEELCNKAILIKKIEDKRIKFVLSPDYYAKWKKIKQDIEKAIKQKEINKNNLTNLSKQFWNIF